MRINNCLMAPGDNIYDVLEEIYWNLDLVYLLIMFFFFIYVIGFKLRFSVDQSGYVILLT